MPKADASYGVLKNAAGEKMIKELSAGLIQSVGDLSKLDINDIITF